MDFEKICDGMYQVTSSDGKDLYKTDTICTMCTCRGWLMQKEGKKKFCKHLNLLIPMECFEWLFSNVDY